MPKVQKNAVLFQIFIKMHYDAVSGVVVHHFLLSSGEDSYGFGPPR
jgi:hypothetical protein